jgi:hypothetical protein
LFFFSLNPFFPIHSRRKAVDIMTRRLFLVASVVLLSAATAQARSFTVDKAGDASTRRMVKVGTLSTTLRDVDTGGDQIAYSSTGKAAKDANKVTATLGTPSGPLNGSGQTATVNLTFGKVGKFTSTFDIGSSAKALLLKGAKGTPNVAASMQYEVNVVEQRKLKVTNSTLKLGSVLRGANIAADYNVITKNKTPGSASYVTIAKNGVLTTGGLTVNETSILSDATSSTIRLSGRLTNYDSKVKVKGSSDLGGSDECRGSGRLQGSEACIYRQRRYCEQDPEEARRLGRLRRCCKDDGAEGYGW